MRSETFGGGGYYAFDAPTLDRADRHGCLDEDVNTGDPLVCRECAYPDDSCCTCGDPVAGAICHHATDATPHPSRGGRA